MLADQPLIITLDGRQVPLGLQSTDPLVRAVIVSLFTWRRANPDDALPGSDRMGWWGDTYAPVLGDRMGSRLWLLTRSALLTETVTRAREYASEALQWLIDDGVAQRVEVQAERQGTDRLALSCVITRVASGDTLNLRFDNVWSLIRAV